MKSYFITGRSGFIGSAFNDDVRYINLRENEYENLAGCSAIIHLAGLAHRKYTNVEYQAVNVELTVELCEKAAQYGVRRFVYLSSINVSKLLDNNSIALDSATMSKYKAEMSLIELCKEKAIELVIVRAPLVYGPNAPGNFGLLTKLVSKLPFLPFGLVNNKRNFVAVQNLVDLLVTCATQPNAAGHTFFASDGQTVSIKEFTNAIAKGLDKTLIQLPVPISWMRFAGRLIGKSEMVEQLLGNLQVDASNAQEVLGWVAPYTMEQAMASLSETKK